MTGFYGTESKRTMNRWACSVSLEQHIGVYARGLVHSLVLFFCSDSDTTPRKFLENFSLKTVQIRREEEEEPILNILKEGKIIGYRQFLYVNKAVSLPQSMKENLKQNQHPVLSLSLSLSLSVTFCTVT